MTIDQIILERQESIQPKDRGQKCGDQNNNDWDTYWRKSWNNDIKKNKKIRK